MKYKLHNFTWNIFQYSDYLMKHGEGFLTAALQYLYCQCLRSTIILRSLFCFLLNTQITADFEYEWDWKRLKIITDKH
jgi:hypothetical protein